MWSFSSFPQGGIGSWKLPGLLVRLKAVALCYIVEAESLCSFEKKMVAESDGDCMKCTHTVRIPPKAWQDRTVPETRVFGGVARRLRKSRIVVVRDGDLQCLSDYHGPCLWSETVKRIVGTSTLSTMVASWAPCSQCHLRTSN